MCVCVLVPIRIVYYACALQASGGSKEAFEAGVAKARALMKEAEDVPVRVDRDLDSLHECSKLYCICKRPYDEQRPMLGCDFCNEWYHYECVGLKYATRILYNILKTSGY
jgi:hypothetical protein